VKRSGRTQIHLREFDVSIQRSATI
jgi:hypothetical protein